MYFGTGQMLKHIQKIMKGYGVEGDPQHYLAIPDERYGDISITFAFQVAKVKGKNPKDIAAEIAAELSKKLKGKKGEGADVEIKLMGPYINIMFRDSYYASLLSESDKITNLKNPKNKKTKVMIEYPSVNPNKPWHVGHLRNALLGDTIANIYEELGYDVERINYIDDLGLQVAENVYSFLNLNNKAEGKFDHWLGKEYVKIHQISEQDKKIEAEIREIIKKLEEREPKVFNAAEDMVEKCLHAQYETSFMYNIYHDYLVYESSVMENIFEEGLKRLKEEGAIRLETEGDNKGCYVAPTPVGDKILIRSDGTVTYTGKDVIFHMWKFGLLKNDFKYGLFMKQPNGKELYRTAGGEDKKLKAKKMKFGNADMIINVISTEQTYPQEVVKHILRALGHEKEADNYLHLAYEIVRLEEGTFSGRKGTWKGFTADELYEEAVRRAVDKIPPEYSDNERKKISEAIGLNAIRYSFIRVSPEKVITFDWDRALSMEGDSGPYLTYAYVRTLGIRRKIEEGKITAHVKSEPHAKAKPKSKSKSFENHSFENYKFNEYEKRLLKQLALFQNICSRTAAEMRTNMLADYLIETVREFNKFYENCKVIGSDEQTFAIRSNIVLLTESVLEKGLTLLGMKVVQQM